MAELFLAQDTRNSRLTVLKRILPYLAQEEEFVQMFLDEARIAGQLNHPNIVQVYELGHLEGSIFIAMEFVEGVDLRKIVQQETKRQGLVPPGIAAWLTARLCEGLHYAHHSKGADGKAMGIIHRDVSPQNLMVGYDGSVKLVDFGIAKANAFVERSKPGVIKGKFLYLSPEQLSQDKIDHRADLFAVGTMLYEVTTGKSPFHKPSTEAVIYAIRAEDPPPPHLLSRAYPTELSRIIMRCLAKDRNKRYQTAAEIQADLEAWIRKDPKTTKADVQDYVGHLFGNDDERTSIYIPPNARRGDGDESTGTSNGQMPSLAQARAALSSPGFDPPPTREEPTVSRSEPVAARNVDTKVDSPVARQKTDEASAVAPPPPRANEDYTVPLGTAPPPTAPLPSSPSTPAATAPTPAPTAPPPAASPPTDTTATSKPPGPLVPEEPTRPISATAVAAANRPTAPGRAITPVAVTQSAVSTAESAADGGEDQSTHLMVADDALRALARDALQGKAPLSDAPATARARPPPEPAEHTATDGAALPLSDATGLDRPRPRTSSAERPPPPVPERSVSVPPRASPERAARTPSGEQRPGTTLERAVVDRLPERRSGKPGPAAAELSMERTSLSGSGALKTGESLSVLTPSGFDRKPGPPVESRVEAVDRAPRESGPERRSTAARPLVSAAPMETKSPRSPGRLDSVPSLLSGATDPRAGHDDPDDVLPTSDYRRQSAGGPSSSSDGSSAGEAPSEVSGGPAASRDDDERSETSDGGSATSQGGSTGLVQWAVARPWAVAVASFVGFGLLILFIYAGYLMVRTPPADDRPKGADPRPTAVKPPRPAVKPQDPRPQGASAVPEKAPDPVKPVEPDPLAQVTFVAPKGTRISLPDGRQVGPGTYEFRPGVLNIQFICPPKAPPKKGAKPVETIINRAVEAQVHPGLPPLQVRLCSR